MEECGACKLVRYCSDKCREDHREQHSEACRKRAKKLRDKVLFRQLDSSYLGECPICFLPLPLDPTKSVTRSCCSNLVCNGCFHQNYKSNRHDRVKAFSCPFCREPGTNKEENKERTMKRAKANDPAALRQMGTNATIKGITMVHLNIIQRRQNWAM